MFSQIPGYQQFILYPTIITTSLPNICPPIDTRGPSVAPRAAGRGAGRAGYSLLSESTGLAHEIRKLFAATVAIIIATATKSLIM